MEVKNVLIPFFNKKEEKEKKTVYKVPISNMYAALVLDL